MIRLLIAELYSDLFPVLSFITIVQDKEIGSIFLA